MAEDDKLSLHVDTDWKKQAQEEKRRLAEQQQKAAANPPPPRPTPPGLGAVPGAAGVGAPGAAGAAPGQAGARSAAARGRREMPTASFATLVQSIMTQALFYLGELAPSGAEPTLNLDMAKLQIDTLGILEEKTANNLNEDERRLLDAALYETRTRFIQVSQQFIG